MFYVLLRRLLIVLSIDLKQQFIMYVSLMLKCNVVSNQLFECALGWQQFGMNFNCVSILQARISTKNVKCRHVSHTYFSVTDISVQS